MTVFGLADRGWSQTTLFDEMVSKGLSAEHTTASIKVTLKSYREVFFPETTTYNENPNYCIQPFEEGGIVGVSLDGHLIRSSFTRDNCNIASLAMKFSDECFKVHLPLNFKEGEAEIEPAYVEAPRCLYDAEFPSDTCPHEITVGYALDGFPIKICNRDVSDELDECGGKGDADDYSYYFTDTWPYSLRCFRGTVQTALPEFLNSAETGEMSCPNIYEYVHTANWYIASLNHDTPFHEFLNHQKESVEAYDQMGRTTKARPAKPNKLEPFTSVLTGFFDDIGKGLDQVFGKNGLSRKRRMADQYQHELKSFGVIPFGYFGTTDFEYCERDDCTFLCSQRRSAGCSEDGRTFGDDGNSECLGYLGAYRRAVVCNRDETEKVMSFGAWNKNNEYSLTPRMGGHMYNDSIADTGSSAWDCHCRDYGGYQLGQVQSVSDTAVTDMEYFGTSELVEHLGCDACPANLIPWELSNGPVKVYATCAGQTPVFLPDEPALKEMMRPRFKNHCTCPPGTLWSWLRMWCMPEDSCATEEAGVPVPCELKNKMFQAMGWPSLECDKETGDYPEHHCFKQKRSDKAFCWSINEYGDRIDEGEWTMMEENQDDGYKLEDGQWLSEWVSHATPYHDDYSEESYESEWIDESFFQPQMCKPVKMIVGNIHGVAYDGSVCLDNGYISADLYNKHGYTYASYYCNMRDGGKCPDAKIRFVCEYEDYADAYDNYDDYDDYAGDYDGMMNYTDITAGPAEISSSVDIDAWTVGEFIVKFDMFALAMDNEDVGCRALFIQELAKHPSHSCSQCFDEIYTPCMARHEVWMNENLPEIAELMPMYAFLGMEKAFFCENKNVATNVDEWSAHMAQPLTDIVLKTELYKY